MVYLVPLQLAGPLGFFFTFLFFCLRLLLVYLLAGDEDVVLVKEVAMEGFRQVLDKYLHNGPLEFLLL